MTGETITLTPDDVLAFFKGEPGSFSLDTDAVADFVDDLKQRYDTYERERPFVDRYGDEIIVGTRWDTYGFKMDLDATTALLKETLEGHERHAQIRVGERPAVGVGRVALGLEDHVLDGSAISIYGHTVTASSSSAPPSSPGTPETTIRREACSASCICSAARP